MRKICSIILALAMVLSLTACDKSGSSDNTPDSSDMGTAQGESPDAGGEDAADNGGALSNPVKKTAEGDIDMDAALSYETDFEAFKTAYAAKEVDLSQPVSENARKNEKTMEVFNYLKGIYGKQILSCQQQMDLNQTYEDNVFYNASEDIPAMKGFDFIFCTGAYVNRSMVDSAIEWATKSGGLVTFTWHWNVPRDIDDLSQGYAFYQEDIINWNPLNATTPGTKEYEVAVHDIDLIASYLQEMEENGVTVLFRPFHEASGSWFWWGLMPEDIQMMKADTYPETFQRLWYMMFDRLENYHKLSNIIWVWNGQSKHAAVDPNTYDIAGIDYYASKETHSPCANKYNELAKYTYEGKMLALSECGYMPDPQQCVDEGIMWLYYMIWNGDFIYEAGGSTAITDFYGTPSPNTERLTNEMIAEYYANDALITWNKLPQFSFGEKNIPEPILIWNYERPKDE